jgi:hypothetical protein
MTIDSIHFFQRRWDLWKQAKHFPDIPAKSDISIIFVLGQDDFGFEYKNKKKKYSGPKLDLSNSTVKLKIVKLSYPPSLLDAARGEDWATSSSLCTVTGNVSSPDTDGEVTFSLSATDTDGLGHYLGQIQVENNTTGDITIPGHIRFNFLENLF